MQTNWGNDTLTGGDYFCLLPAPPYGHVQCLPIITGHILPWNEVQAHSTCRLLPESPQIFPGRLQRHIQLFLQSFQNIVF